MSIKMGQDEVQEQLKINVYESNVDPENFYTKDEVDSLIANIKPPSLTGYATEAFVEGKVADLVNSAPEDLNTLKELAEAISDNEGLIAGLNNAITSKADKTEIPSLNGYATEQWVEDKLENLEVGSGGTVDLSEYAKKTELFSKDYNDLTNKPTIPSLTGYATETYVNNKVSTKANQTDLDAIKNNEREIKFSTEEVYGGYELRSITIDGTAYNVAANVDVDLTDYATTEYVDSKTSNIPTIVYSSTQPSNPTTGMIWLEPV